MTDARLTLVRKGKAAFRVSAREATSEGSRALLDIASDFENRAALRTNPWAPPQAPSPAWRAALFFVTERGMGRGRTLPSAHPGTPHWSIRPSATGYHP